MLLTAIVLSRIFVKELNAMALSCFIKNLVLKTNKIFSTNSQTADNK